MSGKVAVARQELLTQGWSRVPENVSPRLRSFVVRYASQPEKLLELTRPAFDGLPMRMTEGIVGDTILSSFGVGPSADPVAWGAWHRGRSDTVESGAPGELIPGFDFFVAPDEDAGPCRVDVIPGGGRLRRDDPLPVAIARTVELVPGDLLILDSRLPRRWSGEGTGRVFRFATVRVWMTPEMDVLPFVETDVPPRAARFYGVPAVPPGDVGEWLVRSHPARTAVEAAGEEAT